MKQFFCLLLLLILLTGIPAFAIDGASGSSDYLYDSNKKVVPVPPAYIHENTWMASTLEGVDSLKNMQSACVRNGKIYISCTTQVLIFTEDFELLYASGSYTGPDGRSTDFDSNSGIFAAESGEYYICEPNRSRILHFDADHNLLRVLDSPNITGVDAAVKYRPTELVVDDAGRIFVVAKGMYEGIVELDRDGNFTSFYGVNEVRFSLWSLFWRKLSTQEQRSKQSLWLPTDFTNLCIDRDGFIFATVQSSSAAESIMRLNAKGENILRVDDDDEYPQGDLWKNNSTNTGAPMGASEFVAVDTNDFGIYICLDTTRSRVFAYNEDGKLLFVFGGPGNREGYFRGPVDVDFLGDRIMVLDSTAETIEVFRTTEYGTALMNAVRSQYEYDYSTSEAYWRSALSYNQNLFIAYSGIGRAMLRSGDAEGAMKYLKLGDDRKYYSKALEKVRNARLKVYLIPVVLGFIGFIVLLKLLGFLIRRRHPAPAAYTEDGRPVRGNRFLWAVWRYPMRVLSHPFKAFDELKFEQAASMPFCVFILFLSCMLNVLEYVYTGFLINFNDLYQISTLYLMLETAFPVLLFVVGNWSVTTLLNGKGHMFEIFETTMYALFPFCILRIISLVLSNYLLLDEMSIVYALNTIGAVLFVFYLFIGLVVIHEYNFSQGVGMVLLTLAAILIIVFVLMLGFSLAADVWDFFRTVWRELQLKL